MIHPEYEVRELLNKMLDSVEQKTTLLVMSFHVLIGIQSSLATRGAGIIITQKR